MPYISATNDRRERLRNGEPALTAGELNYQLFYYYKHAGAVNKAIVENYVRQFLGEKPNYQRYNDMTGALIRCAFELERRLNIQADVLLEVMVSYNEEIDKYEDLKIAENSDVE